MENNDPGFAVLISSSKKRVVIAGFHYQETLLIKIRPRPRERWRDAKRADSFVQWFHEIWKGQLWETNRIKEKKLQLGYWLLLFVEEQKEIYLYESPRWSNIFPSSSEERAEPECKLLISFSCAQELWEVTDKDRRYKYPKLVSSIGWLGSNR